VGRTSRRSVSGIARAHRRSAGVHAGQPQVALDPELALALFVAPTLLDAAYDASPATCGQSGPVASLALGAVAVTIAAVAVVARMVAPEMSWAAAITLGAIVAPPDASAAAAVLRRLKLPHRVLVVLEGKASSTMPARCSSIASRPLRR